MTMLAVLIIALMVATDLFVSIVVMWHLSFRPNGFPFNWRILVGPRMYMRWARDQGYTIPHMASVIKCWCGGRGEHA